MDKNPASPLSKLVSHRLGKCSVRSFCTGKKKSKFKTFKKFFGKKKRKESPSSTGSSTWKQSQAKDEVVAMESRVVGYDSEDELE